MSSILTHIGNKQVPLNIAARTGKLLATTVVEIETLSNSYVLNWYHNFFSIFSKVHPRVGVGVNPEFVKSAVIVCPSMSSCSGITSNSVHNSFAGTSANWMYNVKSTLIGVVATA